MRTIAHRGDSESARENTVEAVLAAVDAGADLVEIDVRTTADGRSVVLHDATTLRLWGRAQKVSEQTVAELATLGSPGRRIPTLVEVVDALAAAERVPGLLVDSVDADDAEVAWRELSTHPAVQSGQVAVSWCGWGAPMQRVREVDEAAVVYHNHRGGPLDLATIERQRPALINVEWTNVTPDLVTEVHDLGLEIGVWTVDDAEQMGWLFEAGIDSLTTNRPRLARRLATGEGTTPLSLAWLPADDFAARAGIDLLRARWITVARQLGEWAIEYTRTARLGTILDKKDPSDVVTAVDMAVERHLREVILTEFPDHLIVGEEYGGVSEPGRPTWYIDPVDGTTNLANNIPWTSMSLALAIDDQPVVACTIQPWTGELFLAARGLGAVRNGAPLQTRRVDSLAGKALLVEAIATGMSPIMAGIANGLADEHCAMRVMGSGTLTMTRVADNCGVGGLVHRFSAIDHLAGVLIAAEAGARIVNEDGGDSLFPSSGGMLVAPSGAAEKIWPIWQKVLAGEIS